MAMPSVTVMVQNSRGVPPAALHALLDRLRLAHQRDVAGRGLVPAVATPTNGWWICSSSSGPWRNSRSDAAHATDPRSRGGWAISIYRFSSCLQAADAAAGRFNLMLSRPTEFH
jgi:hypothetical protein